MRDTARSNADEKLELTGCHSSLDRIGRLSMNKYEAVLIASKEARRINELTDKEEKELLEKPTIRALQRLSDEKLKAETPEE